MRLVVQIGTGKKANAPGYLVGGKTGTADKQKGRGYATNSRLASFVAAFPMNDPRFAIVAMVDEPKPNKTSYGYATAGWVTAPVIGAVVERIAPLYGLKPIPDDAPEAQNPLVGDGRGLRFAILKKGAIGDQAGKCTGPDPVRRRCRADPSECVGETDTRFGGAA